MPTEVMPKQAIRAEALSWTPDNPNIVFPVKTTATNDLYEHLFRIKLLNIGTQRIFFFKGVGCDLTTGNVTDYLDPDDSVVIDDYIGAISVQGETVQEVDPITELIATAEYGA